MTAAKRKSANNVGKRKPKVGELLPAGSTMVGVDVFRGAMPGTQKQKDLCIEYIKDHHIQNAAIRAGWTESAAKARAYEVVDRYQDYIQYLEAVQAKANAKQIAIELEPLLQEIARIALVNDYDYIVIEPANSVNEKPTVRRKYLHELTREQMSAIQVYKTKSGELDFKLRDKEGRLIDLVRHLGGFNEKIILEHRHRHLHAHVDLTDVPQAELEAMEAQMDKLIANRMRGQKLKVS